MWTAVESGTPLCAAARAAAAGGWGVPAEKLRRIYADEALCACCLYASLRMICAVQETGRRTA